MKLFNKKQTHPQSGFTLIEVLITLVVFAVGLLGLAALQIRAMQFVHDAYIHSQAQVLAYDVLDRIRANRIEAMSLTTSNYVLTFDDNPAAPGTNCAATDCTAPEMAQFDLYEWREMLKEHMPQGKGAISFSDPATGRRIYTIQIQWLDDRTSTVTDEASFNDRFQTFSFEAEL